VEIRPGYHKVNGPLADFDPCHTSFRYAMPDFFASKLGEKPPLMIIAHGGGGPGAAEIEMMRRMNRVGVATLLFDAYEMNGFAYKGTMLFVLGVTNESRQRMIYKATLGAYQWAIKQPEIDTTRIFIHGLSNGGSVAVNMAGVVDPAHVPAVIAEGASPTGLGFPLKINVPLKMVFGRLDNYGGKTPDDWMYTRTDPCEFNVEFKLAPPGLAADCSGKSNPQAMVTTPLAWVDSLRSQNQPVEVWFYENAAHGILFVPMKQETRTYGVGPDAKLRYGWTGSSYQVADRYMADILKLIRSSYP
jgi:dienelactone hydrolase